MHSSKKRNNKTKTETVIAEWQKNATEVVRVMLQPFHGKIYFSVRVWVRDTNHEVRATRHGINLPIENLRTLSKAVKKARHAVHKLLPSETSDKGGQHE